MKRNALFVTQKKMADFADDAPIRSRLLLAKSGDVDVLT